MSQVHVVYCVHIGLICDSQKLKTTQMPHNRRMDTENVVHLNNGILLSYEKPQTHEFYTQMNGT